jgi:hypothetical protein
VALEVTRSVLTLAVRLIDRFTVDAGARRPGALVVRIDVVDVDNQAGIRDIGGARRFEIVFGRDSMEPD